MENKKLIILFKNLTNAEIRQLEDFVCSSIFNKSEQLINLFQIIKKFAIDSHLSLLTKDIVSAQLFPHKKGVEENGLAVAMTKLTKLLEQFLAFQKYQKNENLQDIYLLEDYLERDLNTFVGKKIIKISKKRGAAISKSIDFYGDEVNFLEQQYRFSLRQKVPTKSFHLQEVSQTLDTLFILKKLKHASYIANRENIYEAKHQLFFIDEILKNVEEQNFYENKAIEIYYVCFKMLQEKSDVFFEKLKLLLKKEGKVLTKNELKNLYSLMQNFCSVKIRNGEDYSHERLAIYLTMLDENLLYDGKFIYHKHIKNIVTLALKAKKFALAKKLTKEYRTAVEPKFRSNLYHLNIGAYHFYKEEFEQANRHFEKIVGINSYYETNRRLLLLKSYYEMNNELLEYEVDNFLHFVRNNKEFSNKVKKGYLNFAKIIFKLYKIRNIYNKQKVLVFIQKIELMSPVSDKDWLLLQAKKML